MNIILIPYLPSAVRVRPMAKYFAKSGDNVHVIIWNMPYPITFKNIWDNLENSWQYKTSIEEGVIIHKIRRLPFFFPPINKWLFKKQVRRIFNKSKIDIIISETYFNETEPPLDLPILYDMSDDHTAFARIYGSKIYKFAWRILNIKGTIENQIRDSKAIIAVSDNLITSTQKHRSDEIFKITNGVEGWVVNQSYMRGKKYSLVYVTNFGKWSELHELLFIIKELKVEYPDIQLALIGEGPEIPGAKKIVEKLGLEKSVQFVGKIDNRENLFKEVNKYEVCLNISEKNAFRDSASPMKIFEYAALGKKIVSTNLQEVENLHFPNIFFYEKDVDNKSLASAIKIAFETEIDVNKTKQVVTSYTWEAIIPKIKQIISSAI